MNKEEFINSKMKLSKEDIIYDYYNAEEKLIEKLGIEHKIYELEQQCKKQKEVIDDCKEDISYLLDIIDKNCNELKCTSDEWLVIQKYQDKEVSE